MDALAQLIAWARRLKAARAIPMLIRIADLQEAAQKENDAVGADEYVRQSYAPNPIP